MRQESGEWQQRWQTTQKPNGYSRNRTVFRKTQKTQGKGEGEREGKGEREGEG